MEKTYFNFKEIETDLRRLNLERQIAKQEIISVKGDLKESLQPAQWIQTAAKFAGKFGAMLMVKRLFK